MNLESLNRIIMEFPPGSIVYHRATSKKGIITEYSIDGNSSVALTVAFDHQNNSMRCYPYELSGIKPPEEDGDEWKGDDSMCPLDD